jgi:hypothetical protein
MICLSNNVLLLPQSLDALEPQGRPRSLIGFKDQEREVKREKSGRDGSLAGLFRPKLAWHSEKTEGVLGGDGGVAGLNPLPEVNWLEQPSRLV